MAKSKSKKRRQRAKIVAHCEAANRLAPRNRRAEAVAHCVWVMTSSKKRRTAGIRRLIAELDRA